MIEKSFFLVVIVGAAWILAGSAAWAADAEPKSRPAADSPPAPAKSVRPAAVAGSWYPDDAEALTKLLRGYLDAAKPAEPPGEPLILIAPHAGYRFSGPTAAAVFKTVAGKTYSRVVLLGPSHTASFTGGALPTVTHFATPLGEVPLDVDFCRKLTSAKGDVKGTAGFFADDVPHAREHCLEMELPLLQLTVKDLRIVPIVVGHESSASLRRQMAAALRAAIDDKTLLVVSSDFTHYGSNYNYTPDFIAQGNVQENLARLDGAAVERILSADARGFADLVANTGATICGAAPVALALEVFDNRSDLEGVLLEYTTSGAIMKDWKNSVSYVALAVCGGAASPLTQAEQKTLLAIARDQVRGLLRDGKMLTDVEKKYALTPRLKKNAPAFVTLTRGGELRGCIGHVLPVEPLHVSVMNNAVNACKDPRFTGDPITAKEEPDLHVEISVLSRHKLIASTDEIKIGRDGLIMRRGPNSGLFLPQVPVDQHWDLKGYLVNLCRKAGLPASALDDPQTRIYRFTAQVFGEPRPSSAPTSKPGK